MDISIIIPAYNREKTIEKCINSLIPQLKSNIEIIIVDDGSSDNTVSLCEKYANNNIKLIKQEHGGVSAARNSGIESAKGKYITFIDSDDYVGKNYIEILENAVKNKPQFVIFDSFEQQKPSGEFFRRSINLSVCAEKNIDDIYEYLVCQKINNVWLKLFRADIIADNNVRFDTNMIIAEDYLFVMDYTACCDSFDVQPHLPYYFNFNMSGTYSVKAEHLLNLINAYEKTYLFMKNRCKNPDTEKMQTRFLQQVVETASKLYEKNMLTKDIENKLVESDLYQDLIKHNYNKAKSKIEKLILSNKSWGIGIKYFYAVRALEKFRKYGG